MLNFFKRKIAPQNGSEAETLVEALAIENRNSYPFVLENFPTGQKILEAGPDLQR